MANKITSATLFLLLLFSTLSNACKLPPWEPTITKTRPAIFPRKDPPANPFCPRDKLRFGVCADVLAVGSLVPGRPLGSKCCALLHGLTGPEAAACLCTVIKESVLGVTVIWSVAVSSLVSSCKKKIPDGFKCV